MRRREVAPPEDHPDLDLTGEDGPTAAIPEALIVRDGDEAFGEEPPYARTATLDRWFEEAEDELAPYFDEDDDRHDDDEPEMALIQDLGIEINDGESPADHLRPLLAEPEDLDDELAA